MISFSCVAFAFQRNATAVQKRRWEPLVGLEQKIETFRLIRQMLSRARGKSSELKTVAASIRWKPWSSENWLSNNWVKVCIALSIPHTVQQPVAPHHNFFDKRFAKPSYGFTLYESQFFACSKSANSLAPVWCHQLPCLQTCDDTARHPCSVSLLMRWRRR